MHGKKIIGRHIDGNNLPLALPQQNSIQKRNQNLFPAFISENFLESRVIFLRPLFSFSVFSTVKSVAFEIFSIESPKSKSLRVISSFSCLIAFASSSSFCLIAFASSSFSCSIAFVISSSFCFMAFVISSFSFSIAFVISSSFFLASQLPSRRSLFVLCNPALSSKRSRKTLVLLPTNYIIQRQNRRFSTLRLRYFQGSLLCRLHS